MTENKFVSRYERRVTFVEDVIEQNSELGGTTAHDLAVRVVHAIDHIPEPTR